ncbi:MAG: glycosyltransferase family 4 protein [Hyphomicrobiaceae bacterium]
MSKCAFIIPGDIHLPTGGYAYDRRVLALLPQAGIDTRHVMIPGTFPSPSRDDLATTEQALAALPADTVLLFDGLAYGALPATLIDRIKQPIVALCHHPLALETGNQPDRVRELAALETAALARAAHVVVSSPMTRATLAADFGVPTSKVTVAEPGTDRAPRCKPWKQGPLELLAVGSVIPRKGYAVLVDALGRLRRATDGFDWRLRIAGSLTLSPGTVAEVKSAIVENALAADIVLLGAVDTPTLDQLYAEAHVFVMSSLYEGYGMVLAEAMVRGLPIVCTTGGAAADLVPDTAGLKVLPGDAVALRLALQRILTQPALLADLAEGSYAAGQKLPRWEDTTAIIAEVIKRVAS